MRNIKGLVAGVVLSGVLVLGMSGTSKAGAMLSDSLKDQIPAQCKVDKNGAMLSDSLKDQNCGEQSFIKVIWDILTGAMLSD